MKKISKLNCVFTVASFNFEEATMKTNNYGLVSNFAVVAKNETFFMEEGKMVGADTHTAEYLAQQSKKEAKRAKQLAKSKEFYKLNVVKDLKRDGVDVESMDKELLALIAEQALDLEKNPNAWLQNDEQDMVKVQVQRYNPESGRWYNAKNKDGSLMVEYFTAEGMFEYDEDGRIVGMKTINGQTALAYVVENTYNLVCVHTFHYIDKETNELVFKSIEQRFIVSGKMIDSNMVVEGEQLEATVSSYSYGVNKEGEVVKAFQFFGYDNLVDIGEGFFLMPSTYELTGADMDEADYEAGIIYGTSQSTTAMSINDQARNHIKAQKDEEAKCEQVARVARRQAQTKKDVKASNKEDIKKTELYAWASMMQELTFDARKNAKLQMDLFAKFEEMKDQADDLLEVLAVLKDETGKGFAHPSWVAINALSRKPKADSNKAFAEKVKAHIRDNILAINDGSLDIKGMDKELAAEIIKVAQQAKAAGASLTIKSGYKYGQLLDIAGVARKVETSRNGKVKEVNVADYLMSRKA